MSLDRIKEELAGFIRIEVESMRAALNDLESREKIDWSSIVTRMTIAHAHTRSECVMMCRENAKLRARLKELES